MNNIVVPTLKQQIFTARKRSLEQGDFLTPVCQSFYSQCVCVPAYNGQGVYIPPWADKPLDIHPSGKQLQVDTPWTGTLLGRHPPGQTPP